MPARTFDYADYHRTVIGFHGTTTTTADDLVSGKAFKPSESDDDWFGKGIYFWEYAPKQAWWWARQFKKHTHPAVIGAIIRLGNCFDLLDPVNVQTLKEFKELMVGEMTAAGLDAPKNFRQHKKLDCAVFNYFYQQAEVLKPIDSARAVYVPTRNDKRAWQGSWIYEEAHIQICVRNPSNILAVWHVRADGRYGK
ncbi:MAG: hypothetical protein JNM56_16175 [Planctomycetia bacterium]|nr:hypothetical protein [Planctomycetia bacterium]